MKQQQLRQTHSREFCAKKAVNSNRVVCRDLDPSRELRCVVFSKQALKLFQIHNL